MTNEILGGGSKKHVFLDAKKTQFSPRRHKGDFRKNDVFLGKISRCYAALSERVDQTDTRAEERKNAIFTLQISRLYSAIRGPRDRASLFICTFLGVVLSFPKNVNSRY
jgi:hypothetical protein